MANARHGYPDDPWLQPKVTYSLMEPQIGPEGKGILGSNRIFTDTRNICRGR